jgi:hypothetical protein
MRLDDNLAFFENFKGNIEDTAQIKIAYHWRKKLKWIYKRRLELERNQKEDSPPKGVQSKVKPYIDGKTGAGSFRRGLTKNKNSFNNSKTSMFNKDRKSKAETLQVPNKGLNNN